MTSYPILRWDPIMLGNNLHKYTTITIKGDPLFEEMAIKNNMSIYCKIMDTENNSLNNLIIPGVVYPSYSIPNFRPNYFANTNTYMIILNTNWVNYPYILGNVIFMFEEDIESTVKDSQPQNSLFKDLRKRKFDLSDSSDLYVQTYDIPMY